MLRWRKVERNEWMVEWRIERCKRGIGYGLVVTNTQLR